MILIDRRKMKNDKPTTEFGLLLITFSIFFAGWRLFNPSELFKDDLFYYIASIFLLVTGVFLILLKKEKKGVVEDSVNKISERSKISFISPESSTPSFEEEIQENLLLNKVTSLEEEIKKLREEKIEIKKPVEVVEEIMKVHEIPKIETPQLEIHKVEIPKEVSDELSKEELELFNKQISTLKPKEIEYIPLENIIPRVKSILSKDMNTMSDSMMKKNKLVDSSEEEFHFTSESTKSSSSDVVEDEEESDDYYDDYADENTNEANEEDIRRMGELIE